MSYLRCGKCGGQRLLRRVIDEGFIVIESSCLQCGYSGPPPPMPEPEDNRRRSRRGGGHLGPRQPFDYEAD